MIRCARCEAGDKSHNLATVGTLRLRYHDPLKDRRSYEVCPASLPADVAGEIERQVLERVEICPGCGGERVIQTAAVGQGHADDLAEYAPCPVCAPFGGRGFVVRP